MVVVIMKEVRLVIMVDDLDFRIRNVAFEAKVFNRYGTFDRITNKSMEDPNYAYLHYDLLDKATLTTIILKVKLPHMCEQHVCEGGKFGIESKFKRVLKRMTCMLSLQFNRQPLCHQFLHLNSN
jgi:hypothetical protein